jgi:hypothetical protein
MHSSGWFTRVCRFNGNVLEHCLFHLHRWVSMKMEQRQRSETSVFKLQTRVNNPEAYKNYEFTRIIWKPHYVTEVNCKQRREKNRNYEAAQMRFLDMFAKLQKANISCVMSVCPPHGTTRLPLDGFSRNLIFENCSKTYIENSGFFKI